MRRVYVKTEIMKVVDDYLERFCDKSGNIHNSNFSRNNEIMKEFLKICKVEF